MTQSNADKQQKNSKKKVPGTPFKKGQSGNPKGRPKKGSALADIINRISEQKHIGNTTNIEALIVSTYRLAIAGDSAARNFIADRTEGKAVERIQKEKVKSVIEIL